MTRNACCCPYSSHTEPPEVDDEHVGAGGRGDRVAEQVEEDLGAVGPQQIEPHVLGVPQRVRGEVDDEQ